MKAAALLPLIAALLLISGCAGVMGPGQQPSYNPYQGTVGLSMSFVPNAPPDQVYEQEQAPIGVQIENDGADDIQGGIVKVITENDIFKAQKTEAVFDLKGRNLYSQQGEQKVLMFPAQAGDLKDFTSMDTNIIATACYRYATHYSSEVCIDPYPFDQTMAKPCTSATLTSTGSGAPVAVTKVDPRMSPQQNGFGEQVMVPQFIVTIQQVSDGEVVNPDTCTQSTISRTDYGTVYISGELGNVPLQCTPNPVILNQDPTAVDQGTITRCTYQGEIKQAEGVHNSLLNLNLQYGFSQRIAKSIKILTTQ